MVVLRNKSQATYRKCIRRQRIKTLNSEDSMKNHQQHFCTELTCAEQKCYLNSEIPKVV